MLPETPQFDEKQVGRLKQLMSLLEPDAITKKEFLDAFKQVVAQIQKLKLSNEQDVAAMREHIQMLSDKLKSENTNEFASSKTEIMSLIQTAMANHDQKMAQMQSKIDSVQNGADGLDADEEKIVQDVLAKIKLPEERAVIMDGPDEVRNKLELLLGDERLSATAIKGLEEFIKSFIPQRSLGGIPGWGAHPLAVAQSGTTKTKLARRLNFTGATVTHSADGITTVAITGGSSGFQAPSSGAINGINATFVWATAPNVIVVDQGRAMQKTSSDGTVNWTGTTTTVLTVAPTSDVYAVS